MILVFAERLMQIEMEVAGLDEQIRHEQKRRWPDVFRLQRLKKLKLAIHDQIGRIMRTHLQAVIR